MLESLLQWRASWHITFHRISEKSKFGECRFLWILVILSNVIDNELLSLVHLLHSCVSLEAINFVVFLSWYTGSLHSSALWVNNLEWCKCFGEVAVTQFSSSLLSLKDLVICDFLIWICFSICIQFLESN